MNKLVSGFRSVHFSKALVELFLSRLMLRTAFEFTTLFLPIFFFLELGRSFETVAFIFILLYGFHALLTPLTAKLLQFFSMRDLMIVAVPLSAVAILSLSFWDQNPALSLSLFVVLTVLYKSLYWVPYHVDFAEFSEKGSRGRQLSILGNVKQIVSIVIPIAGGVMIATYGFSVSFVVAALFCLLAVPLLFFIPENREEYSFGYFETFKKLFQKQNRRLLLGYVGDGAQMSITRVVWPIFIFLLLNEEYEAVGVVTALTIVGIMILRMVTGNLLDKWSQTRVVTLSSIVLMTGWVVKTFVETAFQIFVVDTYHRFGRAMSRLSVDTATYDQSADNERYIDEFTALKEIALGIGRVGMLLLVIFVFAVTSIKFAFIAAAVASLFVTAMAKTEKLT